MKKEVTTNEIKSITIIGKRWFDKTYGNTYFSSIGLIDGKEVVKIDFAYGYGDHYTWETFTKMANNGLLPDMQPKEVFWRYCERKNILYRYYCSDVNRKKDL